MTFYVCQYVRVMGKDTHTHTHTHTHPYLKHLSVMCDALAIFILFPFVKKKNQKVRINQPQN